jgi:hypothetical protein
MQQPAELKTAGLNSSGLTNTWKISKNENYGPLILTINGPCFIPYLDSLNLYHYKPANQL